eukprot:4666424-Pyramimonas_sp.AAC.1
MLRRLGLRVTVRAQLCEYAMPKPQVTNPTLRIRIWMKIYVQGIKARAKVLRSWPKVAYALF